jgi:hypothetical protein
MPIDPATDFVGWFLDVSERVEAKMAYNLTRSHRHGGKAF